KSKNVFKTMLMTAGSVAVLATLCSACTSYTPPPAAITKSSFTDIPKEDHQRISVNDKYLTLKEAQNIAVRNNPSFRMKYYAVNAARAAYYASFATYLPQLSFDFNVTGTFRDQVSYHQVNPHSKGISASPSLNASWMVFDSLAREMNMLAAKHGWKRSEALELDARRILVRDVAYAYNNVLLAREKIRIAEQDMAFQDSQLKENELKFEVGSVTLSDVLNFKAYYNSAESNLFAAQYNLASYKYALAVLMGLTEGKLPDDLNFPGMLSADGEVLASLSVYLDMALANRPDLRAYREALEVAKYNYYGSMSAFGPKAYFTANIGYGYNRSKARNYDNTDTVSKSSTFTHAYGFNVSWDLFSGGATFFNMRAKQAAMFQSDFELASNWITAISEVRMAYDNYQTAVKQVKLSQKNLELSRKIRDLVDEEYRAGNTELTRLNEAQRDFVDNETTLATYVIEMHNAKAKLIAVTGGF
ncbi:MAG: TolC family protein, partial [Lentisphaeria bacterium]|nr:TolC family protein [Lentisphaeria bacterium]